MGNKCSLSLYLTLMLFVLNFSEKTGQADVSEETQAITSCQHRIVKILEDKGVYDAYAADYCNDDRVVQASLFQPFDDCLDIYRDVQNNKGGWYRAGVFQCATEQILQASQNKSLYKRCLEVFLKDGASIDEIGLQECQFPQIMSATWNPLFPGCLQIYKEFEKGNGIEAYQRSSAAQDCKDDETITISQDPNYKGCIQKYKTAEISKWRVKDCNVPLILNASNAPTFLECLKENKKTIDEAHYLKYPCSETAAPAYIPAIAPGSAPPPAVPQ